jgi:hypothetical protein
MDLDRALVKSALAARRKVWRSLHGGPRFVTVCDLCGRPEPTGLHENIITRGNSQGNSDLQRIVLASDVNLHLLCNRCNVDFALMDPCRRWLTSVNLYRYGLAEVEDWLSRLPLTGRAPFLGHVRAVAGEMDAVPYALRWQEVSALTAIPAYPYDYQEVTLWQSRLHQASR